MKKLKPWNVLQIIDDRLAGKSAYRLAKEHKITPQWVRCIVRHYQQTGAPPEIKQCGRKARPFSEEEISTVLSAYETYHLGAVRLEEVLRDFLKVEMPHNRIHAILRKLKLAKRSKDKSQRRKWVRYEKRHSNSMWHTDWTKLNGKWLIVIIDDASRFIVGWGLFSHATSENSVLVLERAIATYGCPKMMLTGRDTQFYSSPKRQSNVKPKLTAFAECLAGNKIKHILARVNHPQTNGKCERVFGTVKQKVHEFEGLGTLFDWYNNIRPHMSLKDGLETPAHAFLRKMKEKKSIAVKMVVR
jgi:putative transposase